MLAARTLAPLVVYLLAFSCGSCATFLVGSETEVRRISECGEDRRSSLVAHEKGTGRVMVVARAVRKMEENVEGVKKGEGAQKQELVNFSRLRAPG